MKSGKKIIAWATAFALLGITALPVSAEAKITKEETVYVVTESDGSASEVIVSDHLKNAGKAERIEDKSDLSNIENVKGEETFTAGENGSMTWNAEGSDIFYEGNSSKETPVEMGISYFLNGKEVDGKDLEGASGNVKIMINYRNNAVDKNGTTVPFLALTGFIAEDDVFSEIEVDQGKVLDDGDKKIVFALAAPGLNDAMNIDRDMIDVSLEDTVTITGKAKDFDIQDMMTVVTNSVFDEIDPDDIDKLDYDDEIKELDKGAKALVDGSGQLYDGIHTLNENMPAMTDGISQLDSGAIQLRGSLISQMKTLRDSAGMLKDGTGSVLSGLKQVKKALDKGNGTPENPGVINAIDQVALGLSDGASKAREGSEKLSQGADDLQGAVDGVKDLSDGLSQAAEGYGQVQEGLDDSLSSLNENLQKAGGTENLLNSLGLSDEQKQALQPLLQGYIDVANGENSVASGAIDAIKTSHAGASQIYDGLKSAPQILQGAAKQMTDSADQLDTASGALTQVSGGLTTMSKNLGRYENDKKTQTTLIGGVTVIRSSLGTMQNEIGKSINKKGKLRKALNRLVGGTGELKEGAEQMSEGVAQLDDGSEQLAEGMEKLYKEGIKKIVDMYNDDLKGTLNDLEDVIDAGQSYKTFTKLADGMDGDVKFIYKTSIY